MLDWTRRLARLRFRVTADPVEEELAEHFELLRQERLEAGDTPAEAARNARLRLGNPAAIREEVRASRWRHRAEMAARHTRLAFRSFARHGDAFRPAVAILAIGIALSVALFSIVKAVILAPLGIPNQDQVHLLWKTDPANQAHLVGELAYPELHDLSAGLPGAAAVALFPAAPYGNGRTLQTSTGDPVQIESCPASPAFFDVLGIAPALGRAFLPADSAPGAENVVILSDSVWRQQFQSRPSAVNEMVRLNGRPHRIIGVMPSGFQFPRQVGLWVNLPAANRRGMTWLQAIVRLRPGVPREALETAANQVFRLQTTQHPGQYAATQRAAVKPLAHFLTGDAHRQLLLSLGATLLLLLSACLSAGNLFLSKALGRRQEVATRVALGAGLGQIAGQFVIEALVAAALATSIGTLLASAILAGLIRIAPAEVPRLESASIDSPVCAVAALFALVATLACSLGPLLLLSRGALQAAGATARTFATGARLQRWFLLGQATAATVILATCLFFASSYRALLNTDSGLHERQTLTMNLALRGPGITPESYRATYHELLRRLRESPAIAHAAAVLLRPLEGSIGWDWSYQFPWEAGTRDPLRITKANFEVVTPDYFQAIGTPLLEGRDFTERDTAGATPVAIVSASIAAHIRASGREPLGQPIDLGGRQWRIIGVTAEARYRGIRQAGEAIYLSYRQIDIPTNYLIISGRVPAPELMDLVRRTVREVAPDQAIAGEATLGELLDRNTASDRFQVALLLLFAAGALTLSAAGVHSVTRETIAAHRREIAIRVALGARHRHVAATFGGALLLAVVAGAAAGIFLIAGAAPLLEGLLFGVSAREPGRLSAVAAIVILTAIAAGLVPIWRAARANPRDTLSA